jgi:hypothetical protein
MHNNACVILIFAIYFTRLRNFLHYESVFLCNQHVVFWVTCMPTSTDGLQVQGARRVVSVLRPFDDGCLHPRTAYISDSGKIIAQCCLSFLNYLLIYYQQ